MNVSETLGSSELYDIVISNWEALVAYISGLLKVIGSLIPPKEIARFVCDTG